MSSSSGSSLGSSSATSSGANTTDGSSNSTTKGFIASVELDDGGTIDIDVTSCHLEGAGLHWSSETIESIDLDRDDNTVTVIVDGEEHVLTTSNSSDAYKLAQYLRVSHDAACYTTPGSGEVVTLSGFPARRQGYQFAEWPKVPYYIDACGDDNPIVSGEHVARKPRYPRMSWWRKFITCSWGDIPIFPERSANAKETGDKYLDAYNKNWLTPPESENTSASDIGSFGTHTSSVSSAFSYDPWDDELPNVYPYMNEIVDTVREEQLEILNRDPEMVGQYDVLFLTAPRNPLLRPDDTLLYAALRRKGLSITCRKWQDCLKYKFDKIGIVILRTLDNYPKYWNDVNKLLSLIDSYGCPMVNPKDTLEWGLVKSRYMQDLDRAGVPIVPTVLIRRGTVIERMPRLLSKFHLKQAVVKPEVSSFGGKIIKLREKRTKRHKANLNALLQVSSVLVQPFVESIGRRGELGLFFIGGKFSHAVHKVISSRGNFIVNRSAYFREYTPTFDEIQVGLRAIEAIPVSVPYYCRIDLLMWAGRWSVHEFECFDPEFRLVFHFPRAPDSFAHVVHRAWRDHGRASLRKGKMKGEALLSVSASSSSSSSSSSDDDDDGGSSSSV